VELIAKKNVEQPTINQGNNERTTTPTPIEKLPQTKGNELNRPFIHTFFPFLNFALFFVFFSFVFLLFWFFFSPFFSFKWKIKASKEVLEFTTHNLTSRNDPYDKKNLIPSIKTITPSLPQMSPKQPHCKYVK